MSRERRGSQVARGAGGVPWIDCCRAGVFTVPAGFWSSLDRGTEGRATGRVAAFSLSLLRLIFPVFLGGCLAVFYRA